MNTALDADLRCEAVLWDMDGTIVDTEPYWFEAERELVEMTGASWTLELAEQIVGKDLRDGARVLQQHSGIAWDIDEVIQFLLSRVSQQVKEHGVPFLPGAWERLTELHEQGVPTALVTMSWKLVTSPILDQLPFNPFNAVVTGDVVARGKPHPDPYLNGAAALGVPIERCVVVEDSPTGSSSGQASGAHVLVVKGNATVGEDSRFSRTNSLADLATEDLLRINHANVIDFREG